MTSPGIMSVRNRRRRESVKGVASRRAKVYSRWRTRVEKVRGAIDGPPFAGEGATSHERRLFFRNCQVPDTGGTPIYLEERNFGYGSGNLASRSFVVSFSFPSGAWEREGGLRRFNPGRDALHDEGVRKA